MRNNQKGITLIALVITIIVLLILAGVSIAMLTGENGILSRARESVSENEIAEDKEVANLDLDAAMEAFYDSKYVKKDNGEDDTFIDWLATHYAAHLTSSTNYQVDAKHKEDPSVAKSSVTITTKHGNKVGTVGESGGLTWTD